MKSTISAGTSVTDSNAAAAIANVLVKASGWNRRPSCASSAKIGRNDTVMISRLKKSDGPTSTAASITAWVRLSPGFMRSMCLCAFSIMTIAASTMAPMAMAMPPRLMMLELRPSAFMPAKASNTPMGSMMIATRALRTCRRNTMHTRATMMLSSTSVRLERRDGALDQIRAIVDRHDARAFGQTGQDAFESRLGRFDHVDGVGALALRDDAGGDLAFAVQFGDTAAFVGADFDARHVADRDRHAAHRFQHDLRDVVGAFQITAAAHRVFGFAEFDDASTDVAVADPAIAVRTSSSDRPSARRRVGIDDDVVLLDEAADARHLGDA